MMIGLQNLTNKKGRKCEQSSWNIVSMIKLFIVVI